ncbi:hypothetical protein [Pseudomonas sp. A34-9]|uniref:hypothetical protein n=1 Tax=Pseudomonas sp. A34-9 TaxID=3034675 RepID=UPI00240D5F0B|nr:hypothetical protein [Pseudomonas sp. A34-9]
MSRQDAVRPENDGSVHHYWQPEKLVRGMKPADADGFRWIVGRRFVDVEFEGVLQTLHVGVDRSGAYRGKLLTEGEPTGPLIYKNEDRPTWRLTAEISEPPAVSVDRASSPRPLAPTDDLADLPPAAKRPRPADQPPDIDHGGHASSPQWSVTNNPQTDLLQGAIRQLYPASNLHDRQTFLQSFNLLPSQLARLQQAMKTATAMPQWALAHKRRVDDIANPERLDQLARDTVEELNLKRNARHAWYDPESSMTLELREALLRKMGYLRNKYNCLYRTDVPALFRGDERTPFELANDGTMLPRYSHQPGATTHKPMSATFSLKEGQLYAREPDPEYLRFNSQTNRYPGRDADASPPRSDADDSDSSSASDWSDADSPIPWDHDRDYERVRERQKEMFLYALDTRQLEVVRHEENMLFNSTARDTPPTWFPSDDFEGLISVTRSGLEADRLWLLNSALTKGVKVDDLLELAGSRAEPIEASTHAGHRNKHEYDQLIDDAEAAGKPVLKLSGNGNEFGDDIVWP